MALFRNKQNEQLIVEARQITEATQDEIARWCGGTSLHNDGHATGIRRNGTDASLGEWVIRGVQGEFSLCRPDIFAATYEPVESSSTGETAAEKPKPNK